ncbi:MAG: NAD-dependent epimerase/dehydratase family protein [Desulfamplus sp.]|nr:NAD-dependent epimerase/dehydratase family protein [Desulfamplus sp.]
MKTALVTGATGKIGRLLVPELLRQNFRVRLFLRKKSTISSPNLDIFYGDITDYQSVAAAVSGVDYIFHLAALLHISNPKASMYGKFYAVNVVGTKNIVDAAICAGVKRVILFSTISVYGVTPSNSYEYVNKVFSESSPANPLTIYAKTKLLAEQYQASCVTVLRLASVYGTQVTGNYLRLIEAVKRGFFIIPVDKNGSSVNRTLIHENDVVAGAIYVATHPQAAGKIYNLTDGYVHSLEDIIRAIANGLPLDIKILKISKEPLKIIVDFLQKYRGNNIEKIAFYIDKLMENIAVDGQKIQKELGFKPKYNLQNGWYHALSKK